MLIYISPYVLYLFYSWDRIVNLVCPCKMIMLKYDFQIFNNIPSAFINLLLGNYAGLTLC